MPWLWSEKKPVTSRVSGWDHREEEISHMKLELKVFLLLLKCLSLFGDHQSMKLKPFNRNLPVMHLGNQFPDSQMKELLNQQVLVCKESRVHFPHATLSKLTPAPTHSQVPAALSLFFPGLYVYGGQKEFL